MAVPKSVGPLATTLGLGLMLLSCGCGSNLPAIETASVSGRLTYRGQPLESYRVCFFAQENGATEPAIGRTDAQGNFTLGVRRPGDGAVIGINQVWILYDPDLPVDANPEALSKLSQPKIKLPPKYNSPTTAGLEVVVPKTGLANYHLDLK